MALSPPARPNLEYLKKQAKDVLELVQRHKPGWKLADAQHAIARGYGFSSWPSLKSSVVRVGQNERSSRHVGTVSKPVLMPADRPTLAPPELPIIGAWTAAPSQSLPLQFSVVDDLVSITQVMLDASGREVAAKVAFRADGHEHPAADGLGHTLQVSWAHSHLLDAVHKNGDRILARAAYEVSPDGGTLSVSANGQVIRLHRLPCRAAEGRP